MLNTGYSCSSNYHPCQKVNKNTRFHAIVVKKKILTIVGKNGIANNNYIFLRIFYTFINLFILFTANQLPWKDKEWQQRKGIDLQFIRYLYDFEQLLRRFWLTYVGTENKAAFVFFSYTDLVQLFLFTLLPFEVSSNSLNDLTN